MKSIRLLLLVLGLVAAGLAYAPNAIASSAQTPSTAPAPTSTTLPKSTAIDSDHAYTGAVITSSSDPTPRSLNDYQTAVFMQSWLGEAVFGKPEFRDPPADQPVYRVDVSLLQGQSSTQPVKTTVFYASDGTDAFLSVPKGQDVNNPTAEPPPPTSGTWWVAPQRTMDAFNGKGTLVNTAGVVQGTTPRTPSTPQTPDSSSSSSTPWVLYALVIAGAILIIGGSVSFFRRRRGPDDLAPAD
jgi:hypothetical protein